ncbi:hypothetical protein F511_04985 [Dorcoceras hygrometricum]|uniref:Uncharacterized protein n=1 Tax=Dorcoceras hygrometricum TaxID=472368 RepID=A0A2Z7DCN0_9LAMI|nr:hypothetical protein F511_04985 [Dorcoceras hygrometricum]
MFTSATSVPFKGNSNVYVSIDFVCSGGTDMLTSSLLIEQQCLRWRHYRSYLVQSTGEQWIAWFSGCKSVLYDPELEHFFDTALIQGGDITGVISGKYFSISPSRFAGVFELPTEGLSDFSDVPRNLVSDARKIFSKSGVPVVPHGKKKLLKYEYRLLNDILAKSITVKAGSFDDVTTERFQMMTAIHFGLKVNWSKILVPALTMGEATPFPSSKILSPKTVLTYITTNQTADTRGQSDEGGRTPVAIVNRASKSKNKSESTSDAPVEIVLEVVGSNKRPATEGSAPVVPKKRRTMKTKHSPSQANLDIVNIAQDVVPLQIVDPTPATAALKSPTPKRISRKRRLILPTGSDDESIATQKSVKDTHEVAVKPTDEVDMIIEQVLEETLDLGVSEETQGGQHVDEAAFTDDLGSTSPVVEKNLVQAVGNKKVGKEHMSIDDLLMQISEDMMLPSVTAAEITKIRFGGSIHIPGVQERDLYYASLSRISIHDKGKAILEEDVPVRGNPARETVELICGDVDFLVQLRDQVMKDVVEFFHSFSLNKLPDLDSLKILKEKEKFMLEWAETDSLEMVVRRRVYILAKYREMLLRKFLESHRKYLVPGQPWTATTSQIIDLLSAAHSKSLEVLVTQQKENGLPIEQPCTSTYLDTSIGSGSVLAQFFSQAKSKCWVLPMVLIDGVLTPIQGNDFLRSSCKLSLFVNKKKMPEPVLEDNFVPHVLCIEPIQYWEAAPALIKTWAWHRVCTDIVKYHMFGCLRPVSEDVCTDIVVYNFGIERIPASFRNIFAQGILTESFVGYFQDTDVQKFSDFEESSSDGSTVYRSPSPLREESLALGLGFPTAVHEEQFYFVQSPDSTPATSPCLETSTSSTSLSMHFDIDYISLDGTAGIQTSLPIGRTEFVEAIDDLRAFILQRIDDSNSAILSKLHTLERGLRDTLHDQDANARKLINNVCQDAHTISDVQKIHLNDVKKVFLAQGVTAGADSLEIRKEFKALDAKINSLDGQVAAIRNEQLEFQTKIAADILSLSTILERMRNEDRERERRERRKGSRSGSYKRRRF